MAYTFRKAVKQAGVSAVTTSLCLIAHLLSELTAIKVLSIYMAISLLVNFFLVSFLVPPMLVWYEAHLKYRALCKAPTRLGGSN